LTYLLHNRKAAKRSNKNIPLILIRINIQSKNKPQNRMLTISNHLIEESQMVLIKWRDSYSVDIEQIDHQHELLVKLINDMFEVVRDKETNMSPSSQISTLIEYTQEHFDYEEKFLEQAGYEFLDHHKKIHKELVQEVMDLRDLIEKNTDGVSSDLYSFLRNWLVNHILKEDMQYKDCLSAANKKVLQ
jgi:hemerythrin